MVSSQMPLTILYYFDSQKEKELIVDYVTISFCIVMYKLISKVLANRLNAILLSVISFSQSDFVPSRLITENILVPYELIHFLRQKRVGKFGYMSLKFDMIIAYDRVEWSFLEKVMQKLGFYAKWVKLIMLCVKMSLSVYSLMVNRKNP